MLWYEILIIVATSIVALYVIVSAIAATKLVATLVVPSSRSYEVSIDISENIENVPLDDFDNKWDKHPLEVVTFDNLKLNAMYIINPNATTIDGRTKVVIVSHGHICNLIHSIKYAIPFYNMGYNVVIYDQRYFGKSEGNYCTLGINETRDLCSVIDKTREVFGDNCYIALHGESMGAATVVNTLQFQQDNIAFAIADCGYSKATSQYAECTWNEGHFPTYPAFWFCRLMLHNSYGIDMRDFNPVKSLPNVNTPICFIHGKLDKLVLPHHSIDMYNACGNKQYSRLHLIDNAVHARSHLLDKVAYNKLITEYIQLIENK